MQPVIGVTRGGALRQTYRRALEATGVTVAEIGPDTDRGRTVSVSPKQALHGLNGLLLTGGGDVDPALYGAVARHPSVSVEADRDAMELALARAAVAAGLPLFGICRGIQTLNVAMGGSLWQDLPTERPGPIIHREPEEGRDRRKMLHWVDVVKDTALASVLGPGVLHVNSIHHQAIRETAPGCAWSQPRRTVSWRRWRCPTSDLGWRCSGIRRTFGNWMGGMPHCSLRSAPHLAHRREYGGARPPQPARPRRCGIPIYQPFSRTYVARSPRRQL